MAWIGALIGAVAGVGGSAMSAEQARKVGKLGQQAKEYEAQTYEEQAKRVVGSAQRDMLAERRRKEMVVSRAVALAAAGGGGVHDPSVQNILADLDAEGKYREAVALYQGEEEGRKLKEAARLARMEGQIIRKGGQAQAKAYTAQGVQAAAQGFSTLYSKYNQSQLDKQQAKPSSGTGLNA